METARRPGRAAPKRTVNGVLLLDKPGGMTSNRALQRVRHLFAAAKAGHTGTLDPMATGLLPVCFGEATKLSGYLLDASKEYLATACFGATTDTGDREGQILQRHSSKVELQEASLCELLGSFVGPQQQIPPMYSALKWQGRRLHELAREGITVERPPRDIVIHSLRLEGLAPDGRKDCAVLRIRCSKGTYIRTLVEDIGARLGTGAHLDQLRRTQIDGFEDVRMVTLETLAQAAEGQSAEALDHWLQPMDIGVRHLPAVLLEETDSIKFRHGQSLACPVAGDHNQVKNRDQIVEGVVRVYAKSQSDSCLPILMGMGNVDSGRVLAPKRLMNTSSDG